MVNFVNIPKELKTNASFCLWKLEKRSGKPTKVPYNPRTGQLAKTNDPSTFGDFNTAMKAYVCCYIGPCPGRSPERRRRYFERVGRAVLFR